MGPTGSLTEINVRTGALVRVPGLRTTGCSLVVDGPDLFIAGVGARSSVTEPSRVWPLLWPFPTHSSLPPFATRLT